MTKIDFENEFKNLNPAQKDAVSSVYWQIMVVAWPGTGKTQIIGLRTANIIIKTWVDPSNILITTFTDAWVIAIRERLIRFLWNDAYKVNVSTIHSLSQDIIKTFPEKFIEYKAWTPIDEVDSLEALKTITDELIEDGKIEDLTTDYDKYFYLRDIKSRISNLKTEWISIAKFKNSIKRQEELYAEELAEIKPTLKKYETTKEKGEKHIKKLEELVIFYEAYSQFLRLNSYYDFNDMINFVLEKIKEDDELKMHYAEKFQFIMLDEYQDTNDAQNQIIDEILSVTDESPNIMVVGDDDQSIYRFQWANIENMLDFSTKYPETKFIVLENNYRSNQAVLDLATNLIDNNNERLSKKIETINKKLISSWNLKDSKTSVKLLRANSDIEEKTFIVSKIKNLIASWQQINEIAIITRWNREVEEYNKLLEQNWIETESKLKTNILNSKYVDFILNYLEIIDNPFADENKIIDILRSNITDINHTDVLKVNRALYISNYTKKFKVSIIDFISDESNLNELNLSEKEKLIEFRDNLLDFQANSGNTNIIEFFSEFIKKTGIIEYLETHWNFDDLQDIYTLFNKIKDYANLDKTFSITKLIKKIELYKTYNYPIARQIVNENKSWVQILTAHGSKWLEYNNVFIPWLYNWNWENKRVIDKLKLPAWMSWDWLQKDSFDQIEEDRRLFFVAVTRARENLFLSFPAWIWTKPLLQSVFIEEISWSYEEISFESEIDSKKILNSELDSNKECHSELDSESIKTQVTIPEIIKNDIKNDLIEYTDREFDYIKTFLESYKLSPSDLNTFLEEPMEFLNKAVFKYPFIDNQFTIFGKVYHRTLELFYLKYKAESKLPDKSYLTSTFKLLLSNEILLPEEYEKLLEKGISGLEWYYDLHASKKEEPLVLEYSFRRKNLSFEWVPLTGTIDKIEKIGTSSLDSTNQEWQLAFFKDKVALVDYKTGKAKTIWQIKGIDRYWNKKEWEWKYFRQLLFYKLLCEVDYEFNSKFDIWAVALDFVEWKDWDYKYIELEITPEEYEDFKKEIVEARGKISDIEFWRGLLGKK